MTPHRGRHRTRRNAHEAPAWAPRRQRRGCGRVCMAVVGALVALAVRPTRTP